MRYEYKGFTVGVENLNGQWQAWVKIHGKIRRTVVSGYATEEETYRAVERWIDRSGMRRTR